LYFHAYLKYEQFVIPVVFCFYNFSYDKILQTILETYAAMHWNFFSVVGISKFRILAPPLLLILFLRLTPTADAERDLYSKWVVHSGLVARKQAPTEQAIA
jgi:hypothetical protein